MPSAVMFFFVGHRITPLVSPWLTMTKRKSKPEEGGRSVIRSQEICWKGQDVEKWMGGEWGNGGMSVHLVLLASCTAFDVFTAVGGKTRPPEIGSDKLPSFQVSRVASHIMIMAVLEDGTVKGFVVGDMAMTLVGQDACFDLPVGEAGEERERNVLVHRLECLEDKGITSGGRFDMIREGHINNIDKK